MASRHERLLEGARSEVRADRRRTGRLIAGLVSVASVACGLAGCALLGLGAGLPDLPVPTPAETTRPSVSPAPGPGGQATYTAAPDPALAEGRQWTGALRTSVGDISFTLDGAAAPQATANFVVLASDGYYDGSECHRLTTEGIYVLQCGSLTGDGTDDPGYQFGPLENVPPDGIYPPGTIAMARAQAEDSQGAQFFITYQESSIPGGYSVFGHVTSGLEALKQVAAAGTADGGPDGRPAIPVTIDSIDL